MGWEGWEMSIFGGEEIGAGAGLGGGHMYGGAEWERDC